jgi:hypothetical protein
MATNAPSRPRGDEAGSSEPSTRSSGGRPEDRLRTIFDVKNPMKVGCRLFFERETRVTAGRLEDGDDARDGGFDDRSAAQLLFRTDSLGTRSLRQDGAPSRAIAQAATSARTCVNHERDSRPDPRPDVSVQPSGRFDPSMIRGVQASPTTLGCMEQRDAQPSRARWRHPLEPLLATGTGRATQLFSRERAWLEDNGTTRIRTVFGRARSARRPCPLECAWLER